MNNIFLLDFLTAIFAVALLTIWLYVKDHDDNE